MDEMTLYTPTTPTVSIFNLRGGEFEVSFCHISKIGSIGSAHMNKINREAGCKNQLIETYLAKNTIVGVVGTVGDVGPVPITPIHFKFCYR